MSRRIAVSAGLAGVIAVLATLPMFGVRGPLTGLIVFALPGMSLVSALLGDLHTHVAIVTLIATWIIYLAIFLAITKIWRLLLA
ncbi:hypothetical protein EDE15_4942 [Edaphobacter aggregans]|uniref:Uncharacterized protein n=1 Tax=Edaphobacter aggregans TaxID=570835 RepID=A0A3R9QDV3_9BACT|nr:hypothetical protein EDE15_4942 [Edaphobacter aggregans]